MAPKQKRNYKTVKKKTEKVPQYNEKGELCTWNRYSHDAAQLKVFVENGLCDGKKPSEIRAMFPVFEKYSSRCFSSALTNMRKTHNKALYARAAGKEIDAGKYAG